MTECVTLLKQPRFAGHTLTYWRRNPIEFIESFLVKSLPRAIGEINGVLRCACAYGDPKSLD
jgi:hypothetical protein